MLKLVVKIVCVIVLTVLLLGLIQGLGWFELAIAGTLDVLIIALLVARNVRHHKESVTASTS